MTRYDIIIAIEKYHDYEIGCDCEMPGMMGLTGGKEECRLLLGRKPRISLTKGTIENPPKLKVIFEGSFGENKPELLKFCCWRRCVAYGQYAERMKKADVGSLVLIKGWISSEAKRDENGKPVIENGQIVKIETIVCTGVDGYVEVLRRGKVQEKESQLRFGENEQSRSSKPLDGVFENNKKGDLE